MINTLYTFIHYVSLVCASTKFVPTRPPLKNVSCPPGGRNCGQSGSRNIFFFFFWLIFFYLGGGDKEKKKKSSQSAVFSKSINNTRPLHRKQLFLRVALGPSPTPADYQSMQTNNLSIPINNLVVKGRHNRSMTLETANCRVESDGHFPG